MRVRRTVIALGLAGAAVALTVAQMTAQAPARGAARRSDAAPAHANMAQLMRAILFVNSNVLFAVQTVDPATVKRDADPATSINPLASVYGGWPAVESSALALAESATLLTVPGRRCQNGKPVPVQNADWPKFVQELRDAGMAAYKAAQSRSQESITLVTEDIATACAHCHEKYRDVPGGLAARCQ